MTTEGNEGVATALSKGLRAIIGLCSLKSTNGGCGVVNLDGICGMDAANAMGAVGIDAKGSWMCLLEA